MKEFLHTYAQIITWVAIIVIVTLLIIFSGKKTPTTTTAPETTQSASVVESTPEEADLETTPAASDLFKNTQNVAAMTPFVQAPYHYSFEKVSWRLIDLPETAQTKVSIWLDGFTRHEGGEPANLRNPFRGGDFPGTCQPVNMTASDTENTALAFLSCSDDTTTNIVGVFQEEQTIHVLHKKDDGEWEPLRNPIDMTRIIR